MENTKLGREFFSRYTINVAKELLGRRLVHIEDGVRVAGIIIEAEAYRGEEDLGCHAKSGLTPRTRVMYGKPGCTYVYFTYGMHWMLNFVTEKEGFPGAVLVRAVVPSEGIPIIQHRRYPQPQKIWTNGPAKICQAFGITGEHNGADACSPVAQLFIEEGVPACIENKNATPRIGLNNVPEPWKSIPWRFKATINEKYLHMLGK